MSETPAGEHSAEKDAARINLDTARLPDPDMAATGDGRVIAAALNTLTSELRLTNLLLAQSMQNAIGQIVYASHHDAISNVVRERLLHMTTPMRLGSCCVNVGTGDCRCENPTNWGSVFTDKHKCPGCDEIKFVGHGPLCLDCLRSRVTASAETAEGSRS